MDYQSRYTGEEIDALLSKVETLQNAPRDFKVVASKRIPKTNWGPYSTRFTKRPIFTLCPEKDEAEITSEEIKFRAPVLARLLSNNLIQNGKFYGDGVKIDYIGIGVDVHDAEFVIINHEGIGGMVLPQETYLLQFSLANTAAGEAANAIRRYNDETFANVRIITAETTSPNIRIIGGNIVACGLPYVSNLGGNADMAVVVGSPCQFEYRRTGHKRVRHEGQVSPAPRKIRWTFAFYNGSGLGPSSGRKNIPAFAQAYPVGPLSPDNLGISYFRRNNRKMIWVRFHALCKKRRYTSPLYQEVHIVRLEERDV